MAGLWILILGGFMQVFVGGEVTETAMAVGGALLFSGKYLLYEQYQIKCIDVYCHS